MKSLICLVISICVVLSFAGCSLQQDVDIKVADMLELSDDEMITELLIELGEDDFDSLNESEKVIYTAAAFEMEVINGGVVQFLSNEAYGSASYVCEALKKLGAEEHLNLLQQNLEQNKVDINDLSSFVTDDLDAFSKLYNQYNFDSYENEYYNMSSIPDYIRTYIRDHAEDFSQ